MINSRVYDRTKTSTVESDRQTTIVPISAALRLGGSSKFGVTPGGGVAAGPFSNSSSCEGVVGAAMILIDYQGL